MIEDFLIYFFGYNICKFFMIFLVFLMIIYSGKKLFEWIGGPLD